MRARLAIFFLFALLAAPVAQAQSWPSRPVTVVVPFAAGVTGDIVARGLVEHLSAVLGQPFVVDNRSGAGGNIGGAVVAKAAPDGYTLLLSTTGPASSNKLTYKNMPYDPQRDLAPIVLMGKAPVIIVARNTLPANTLKEFVDYAKANPGKTTAGYPGNGTQGHIAGELLQQRAGMSFVQAQYRGSPAIITDILGEHIDIGMDFMAPYVPLIQEKKLRGLAIASAKRWPLLPDVPTVAELRLSGIRGGGVVCAPRAHRHSAGDYRQAERGRKRLSQDESGRGAVREAWHPAGRWHAAGAESLHRSRAREMGSDHQGSKDRVLAASRHCERSEAIQSFRALDCFVAVLLAMTTNYNGDP